MVQDVVRWVWVKGLCIKGVGAGATNMADVRLCVINFHIDTCFLTASIPFPVGRWLGLNGHVLWSQPGAVQQLAAEAPRSSTIYQVGEGLRSGA